MENTLVSNYSARFATPARAAGALFMLSSVLLASSHSDAPLSKQDPQANLTDVYAFVGTTRQH